MSETKTKQQRLPKFRRAPELLPPRQITARSFAIIDLLHRYRFLPTSLINALIPGDYRTTDRQLQALYQNGLINRFVFPKVGTPGEFHYFLDNAESLRLLADYQQKSVEGFDFETVRGNREKNYAAAHRQPSVEGQALFLRHEVMVSRFHAMIELGCRATEGHVALAQWFQGSVLWQTVEVPRIVFDAERQLWYEPGDTEVLPHRPDAFFTLHFPNLADEEQYQHFFYEADRGTSSTKRFISKLRAHFHFVAVQKRHRAVYNTHRVRAVLIETMQVNWAEKLRQAARHPAVSGERPSPLFWFTDSHQFSDVVEQNIGKRTNRIASVPLFVKDPLVAFRRVWKTATENAKNALYSILD